MLTQYDINSINEAKLLWENNVQKKFKEGHTAIFNLLKPIWDDGTHINVGNDVCPLCRDCPNLNVTILFNIAFFIFFYFYFHDTKINNI